MTKDIWMNLPVKDVAKSKTFFSDLGFEFNPRFGDGANCAALMVGDKKVIVMLFEENAFKGFTQTQLADTKSSAEVLFSLSAEHKEEVDDFAKKVEKVGGTIISKPAESQGWMYGFSFADLDGHRWNMLYMDMSKMK